MSRRAYGGPPPSDQRRLQDPVVDDRDPLDVWGDDFEDEFLSWLRGGGTIDPFEYVWNDWDDAIAQLSCCPGEPACDEPLCLEHGRRAA